MRWMMWLRSMYEPRPHPDSTPSRQMPMTPARLTAWLMVNSPAQPAAPGPSEGAPALLPKW